VSPKRGVLHLVICAGGSAPDAHHLADAARAAGWDVYAIPTPNAMEFVDVEQLTVATGHVVRARWRRPGEPGSLPAADAVIVAPATYNTINKWSAGIADVYALGQLAEAVGRRLPIVVLPFVNGALAANPAYARSLQTLRDDGVRLLDGSPDADGVPRGLAPHTPGTGGELQGHFPWADALDALDAVDGHRA
jgi:phosphopantothenoylcysteine synthetase/decarboxylase